MPDPPSTNLFTTYVLESPWLLAGLLLVVAAFLIYRGMREGLMRTAAAGGIVTVLALGVVLTGMLVTTAGEHSRNLVRAIVHAAEEGDVATVTMLFDDDATLHFDRPENPGFAIDSLRRAAGTLADSNRIDGNVITQLRGYTVDRDRGIVHLTCRTTTRGSRGPVVSRWVIHVGRDDRGRWLATRITCVSIAGQSPSPSLFRL